MAGTAEPSLRINCWPSRLVNGRNWLSHLQVTNIRTVHDVAIHNGAAAWPPECGDLVFIVWTRAVGYPCGEDNFVCFYCIGGCDFPQQLVSLQRLSWQIVTPGAVLLCWRDCFKTSAFEHLHIWHITLDEGTRHAGQVGGPN